MRSGRWKSLRPGRAILRFWERSFAERCIIPSVAERSYTVYRTRNRGPKASGERFCRRFWQIRKYTEVYKYASIYQCVLRNVKDVRDQQNRTMQSIVRSLAYVS